MKYSMNLLTKVLFSIVMVTVILAYLAYPHTVYASGGQHNHLFKQAIAASCSSPSFTPPSVAALSIAYVNRSTAVNVRQAPTTGSCVVTTQGPTMNVLLAGPDTNGWYPVLYYFNQGCRSCSHYDWSHTGYMADFLLTKAAVGYTCYESSCPNFNTTSAQVPNSNDCSRVTNASCNWLRNGSTISMTPYALTLAPDWWISSTSCPPDSGCAYVWNDDWWGH